MQKLHTFKSLRSFSFKNFLSAHERFLHHLYWDLINWFFSDVLETENMLCNLTFFGFMVNLYSCYLTNNAKEKFSFFKSQITSSWNINSQPIKTTKYSYHQRHVIYFFLQISINAIFITFIIRLFIKQNLLVNQTFIVFLQVAWKWKGVH